MLGEVERASQGEGVREGAGADLVASGTRLSLAGPPQTRPRHTMQFPAELTKKACRTRPRELRLICMYFFTTRFFPVSAMEGAAGWALASCWGHCSIHATAWALGGLAPEGPAHSATGTAIASPWASVLAEWWEEWYVPRQEAE